MNNCWRFYRQLEIKSNMSSMNVNLNSCGVSASLALNLGLIARRGDGSVSW